MIEYKLPDDHVKLMLPRYKKEPETPDTINLNSAEATPILPKRSPTDGTPLVLISKMTIN